MQGLYRGIVPRLYRLNGGRSGLTTVEYALLIAILVVVAIGVWTTVVNFAKK